MSLLFRVAFAIALALTLGLGALSHSAPAAATLSRPSHSVAFVSKQCDGMLQPQCD